MKRVDKKKSERNETRGLKGEVPEGSGSGR